MKEVMRLLKLTPAQESFLALCEAIVGRTNLTFSQSLLQSTRSEWTVRIMNYESEWMISFLIESLSCSRRR